MKPERLVVYHEVSYHFLVMTRVFHDQKVPITNDDSGNTTARIHLFPLVFIILSH